MQNDKSRFKNDFEKRLVSFSVSIIKFCQNAESLRTFRSLSDQLIRSSSSVGANIIEAKSASSKRDYIKFFEIALKSANETNYWLLVFEESFPGKKNELNVLQQEINELRNIIASSVLTLKGKR